MTFDWGCFAMARIAWHTWQLPSYLVEDFEQNGKFLPLLGMQHHILAEKVIILDRIPPNEK